MSCCHSTFLLFSPSSVMILLIIFSLLFSFFFLKDQIAFFQLLKEIFVFWTKCCVSVYLFHWLRDCDRVWITTGSEYCMQLTVWMLNMNITIEKSKDILSAVLCNVDISKQYFLVCDLKIVFWFLHELKQRSSES